MSDDTAGVEETPTPKQRSYFSGPRLNRYQLDDGLSFIEHQAMDEGLYEEFQDLTSTIKLDQNNETTEIDMAVGRTRRFLLEKLVTGWNLVADDGSPLPFSHKKLKELPPHIIGGLVQDINAKNQILNGADDEGKSS